MFGKWKKVNNHTKQEMRAYFAGEYIKNPEQIPNGSLVTVFEKGTENWWEYGHIFTNIDGKKAIM